MTKKNKMITFSFDDGVTQDVKLIEILNKYQLKATFNINSALLGLPGELVRNGVTVNHTKNNACDIKKIYFGHEVAAHTLTHPNLTLQNDETVIYQVERDRQILSDLCGYEVVGMAYPGGGVNNNEHVAELIKKHTGLQYARVFNSSFSYARQDNLFRFMPSMSFCEEGLFEFAERFLTEEDDGQPKLLYIWGHGYELDAKINDMTWEKFDCFCKLISNKPDIFYGTNAEVLLNK